MDSQVTLIQQSVDLIESFEVGQTFSTSLIDAYRLLRNSVASDEKIAKFLITDTNYEKLIDKTVNVLNSIGSRDESKTNDEEICINLQRCSVQFVGNFCGRIAEAKICIFQKVRHVLPNLLNHPDSKLRNYANFLLFNCLRHDDVIREFCSSKNSENYSNSKEILWKIFECLKANEHESSSEWSLFSLELLITKCDLLVETFWSSVSTESRILLVEICISLIEANSSDGSKPLPHLCNIVSLIDPFVEISSGIVPEYGDFDENRFAVQINLLTPMLTLFCKITESLFELYDTVRRNDRLLRSTVALLKRMQIRCRAGHTFFAVGKLTSLVGAKDDDEQQLHPAFNVKRSLINLISNLCYRLPEQQLLAGQLDAVPLIMDCTEIDSKNSYISQYAVLALRNLLENCQENQRIVAALNPQGVVDATDATSGLNLEPYLDAQGRVKFK